MNRLAAPLQRGGEAVTGAGEHRGLGSLAPSVRRCQSRDVAKRSSTSSRALAYAVAAEVFAASPIECIGANLGSSGRYPRVR